MPWKSLGRKRKGTKNTPGNKHRLLIHTAVFVRLRLTGKQYHDLEEARRRSANRLHSCCIDATRALTVARYSSTSLSVDQIRVLSFFVVARIPLFLPGQRRGNGGGQRGYTLCTIIVRLARIEALRSSLWSGSSGG